MSDNVLTSFLRNFDQYPFCVKIGQDEYKIGEGKPEFVVNFKRPVSMHSLITSTSLALGEAYMNGDLEIEGDLYHTLNHFLGQMGKVLYYRGGEPPQALQQDFAMLEQKFSGASQGSGGNVE